jgi:pimeloyl-ACP methyl ester carboxylesterase
MLQELVERVRVNGLSLAVHRFSLAGSEPPPTRKTVLLLHGFLDAAASWDLVAEPLCSAGFEVVAPDLRGFGLSERVGAGAYYHFPDYVADVDELCEKLAPSWLGVVGHSMGGGVATLFAGACATRVDKLVVMEGVGPASDAPELSVDRFRKWLSDRRRITREPRSMPFEEAVTRLKATHPRLSDELLRSRAARLTVQLPTGGVAWAWDPLHRTVSPTPFQGANYSSFLRAIQCPVLFVDGGPHGWHPPEEEERLAQIAALRRVSFPEAGHMMHWTQPSAVAQAIVDFFL